MKYKSRSQVCFLWIGWNFVLKTITIQTSKFVRTSKFVTVLDILSYVLSTKLMWNPSSLYDKTKTNHLAVTTRWPPFLLLRKNSSRGKEVHFPPHFPLILLMVSCLEVFHKICWQNFGFFWPPTPLPHFLPYKHNFWTTYPLLL